MALHRITPDGSRFTTGIAFNDDEPGPDTLIVERNAFLISSFSFAADLTGADPWTVTINGSVISINNDGISLLAGGTSKITIGKEGSVAGGVGFAGLSALSRVNLKNSVEITAVSLGAGGVVTNSGLISGAISGGSTDLTVTNTGTISGTLFSSTGNSKITNSGTLARRGQDRQLGNDWRQRKPGRWR